MTAVRTTEGTVAMWITLLIEVVAPGKAMILAERFSGSAVRDGGRYTVTTALGEYVGRAASYHEAAVRLALHYGHEKDAIHVEAVGG